MQATGTATESPFQTGGIPHQPTGQTTKSPYHDAETLISDIVTKLHQLDTQGQFNLTQVNGILDSLFSVENISKFKDFPGASQGPITDTFRQIASIGKLVTHFDELLGDLGDLAPKLLLVVTMIEKTILLETGTKNQLIAKIKDLQKSQMLKDQMLENGIVETEAKLDALKTYFTLKETHLKTCFDKRLELVSAQLEDASAAYESKIEALKQEYQAEIKATKDAEKLNQITTYIKSVKIRVQHDRDNLSSDQYASFANQLVTDIKTVTDAALFGDFKYRNEAVLSVFIELINKEKILYFLEIAKKIKSYGYQQSQNLGNLNNKAAKIRHNKIEFSRIADVLLFHIFRTMNGYDYSLNKDFFQKFSDVIGYPVREVGAKTNGAQHYTYDAPEEIISLGFQDPAPAGTYVQDKLDIVQKKALEIYYFPKQAENPTFLLTVNKLSTELNSKMSELTLCKSRVLTMDANITKYESAITTLQAQRNTLKNKRLEKQLDLQSRTQCFSQQTNAIKNRISTFESSRQEHLPLLMIEYDVLTKFLAELPAELGMVLTAVLSQFGGAKDRLGQLHNKFATDPKLMQKLAEKHNPLREFFQKRSPTMRTADEAKLEIIYTQLNEKHPELGVSSSEFVASMMMLWRLEDTIVSTENKIDLSTNIRSPLFPFVVIATILNNLPPPSADNKADNKAVLVMGLGKSGKTSLLNYLRNYRYNPRTENSQKKIELAAPDGSECPGVARNILHQYQPYQIQNGMPAIECMIPDSQSDKTTRLVQYAALVQQSRKFSEVRLVVVLDIAEMFSQSKYHDLIHIAHNIREMLGIEALSSTGTFANSVLFVANKSFNQDNDPVTIENIIDCIKNLGEENTDIAVLGKLMSSQNFVIMDPLNAESLPTMLDAISTRTPQNPIITSSVLAEVTKDLTTYLSRLESKILSVNSITDEITGLENEIPKAEDIDLSDDAETTCLTAIKFHKSAIQEITESQTKLIAEIQGLEAKIAQLQVDNTKDIEMRKA